MPSANNMGDKTEETTLIVRRLPEDLSPAEQEDLLKHFGAAQVRCMGNRGRLKHTAFAVFDDRDEANNALKRLHQLDILGCKLVVEFSSEKYTKHHPPPLEVPPLPEVKTVDNQKDNSNNNKKLTNLAPDSKKITDKIDSFNSKLDFTYPMNPTFEYMYQPPSVSILTNIANALATMPKFYVQVLHLMNKMNLPAPFGAVTSTPPLPMGEPIEELKPFEPDILGEEEMDVSSTEESEIESDEEGGAKAAVPKRPARLSRKKAKRPKIQKVVAVPSKSQQSLAPDPKDVFEQLPTGVVKKIGFKLPTAIAELFTEKTALENSDAVSVPQVFPEAPTDILSLTENEPAEETQGGFGKIEPVPKAEEQEEEEPEEEWGAGEFISSRRLRRGRMKSSEMRHVSVFRNYSAGEPSSRLYIKNLPKQVTEKDMHYVYGKYVKWEDEIEQNTFDIRLMKEGRMKGQCFITLPTVKAAEDALTDTNAFVLHGRPMVVQFARSAKAKETDSKADKDRRK